jgi:tRNA-2-methylthio-N6-dimethylallyladenosine synthase
MKKYWIKTYGCQMNVHDSEKLAGFLTHMDYEPASRIEDADIILLNTCTVREKAAQKVYTHLGRIKQLREKKPDLIIALCGCLAQQEGTNLFQRAPYLNIVLGSRAIAKLPHLIDKVAKTGQQVISLENLSKSTNCSPRYIKRNSSFQAYVTIMEGCNNFCSYCIVPYVRGREIYRSSAQILHEIVQLAEKGYKEVTLLGQNVNSYRDPDDKEINFVELLKKVDSIPNLERIRFITSHPKDFSFELVQAIKDGEKICPYVHLPLQAGSSRILQLMNRKYNQQEYMQKIGWLQDTLSEVSITTDIIVGFPGETEKDFQETIKVAKEVEYDGIFSFKYCHRPFTAASKLKDSVPAKEKSRRLTELQELQKRIQFRKNCDQIGKIFEVLVEDFSRKSSEELTGRTITNKIVNFPGRAENIGNIVKVKIIDAGPNSLKGEMC